MTEESQRQRGRMLPAPLLEGCSRLCFGAGPLLSYCLVEVLNFNSPWRSFSELQILLNLAWYYVTAFFLWLLLGRRTLSAGVSAGFFVLLGVANRYAIRFRGRTIFPGDLDTLGTALNVAGSYDYTLDRDQIFCLSALACFLLALFLLPRRKGRTLPPRPVWISLAAAGLVYIGVFFHTDLLTRLDIQPSMWTTRGNGFLLNYTVSLRYSRMEKPAQYDPDALEELTGRYRSDAAAARPALLTKEIRPTNIIVIMNEAFSDLSYIPALETNEDFLPFFHTLKRDAVKGTAYSSVFGGTTANSEFEFLTGCTTAFLPTGTVPYQLYMEEGMPSLVAQMDALGYRTVGMHPYYASGWNRRSVYRDLGFDRTMFLEDFQNLSYMRGFATDRSDYENIVDLCEKKRPGEPLFIFNVTMQNHSGYNVPWQGLARSVWLTGAWEGRFGTVNQYLSLIRESDDALKYLIEHFEAVREPTMILLFGDHQPQVATNFYTEALGGAIESLPADTAQSRQRVPFLLWANYDIREESGLQLSLNYLSSLLVERANLPKTGFQRFLTGLRLQVPVVNTLGYLEAQGSFTDREEDLSPAAADALEEYRRLQYNMMFDSEHMAREFFFLR